MVSVDLHKITVGQIKGAPSNERLIGEIFKGTKYKVTYEPNMGDYLLCHAAFVIPAVFACYKTDGTLKKLKKNNAYLNRLIAANIEGYRAVKNAGHEILPKADSDFEGAAYRKTCFRFFKLMCATVLGKICVSEPYTALHELERVCRAGGKIIIPTYINRTDNGKTNSLSETIGKAGADFKREFTLATYKQFFADAGYKNIDCTLCEGKIPCAVAVLKNGEKI